MNPKKRMMFIASEDYYFITYSILLILKHLDCYTEEKALADKQKLNMLSELVSDRKLLIILERSKNLQIIISRPDINYLEGAYDVVQTRTALINRVLFILNHHDYIRFGEKQNVYLNVEKIDHSFFDDDVFQDEIENIRRIKKLFSRVRTMRYESLKESVFLSNGVLAWPAL